MTHDKLLNKILSECGCRNTKALRAVVELHKPIVWSFYKYAKPVCIFCDLEYPCLTIQTIEKELL